MNVELMAAIPEEKHVVLSEPSVRDITLASSSTVGLFSLEYLYLSPSGRLNALLR